MKRNHLIRRGKTWCLEFLLLSLWTFYIWYSLVCQSRSIFSCSLMNSLVTDGPSYLEQFKDNEVLCLHTFYWWMSDLVTDAVHQLWLKQRGGQHVQKLESFCFPASLVAVSWCLVGAVIYPWSTKTEVDTNIYDNSVLLCEDRWAERQIMTSRGIVFWPTDHHVFSKNHWWVFRKSSGDDDRLLGQLSVVWTSLFCSLFNLKRSNFKK